MFVCLTLLASFFLPSHLSFKNMYMEMYMETKLRVHLFIRFSFLALPNIFGFDSAS